MEAEMTNAVASANLNPLAISATNHCLTGCVIGEVSGMAIGTGFGWADVPTMVLAIGLAYLFGFGLTSLPLIRARLAVGVIITTALAADTVSITIMEAIDNGVVAYPFAFMANRYLIARGRGHAVVHEYHGHEGSPAQEHHAH